MFNFFKKKTPQYDWIVVGLGNPGDRYHANRHNIGWIIADKLVSQHHSKFNKKSSSLNAAIQLGSQNVLVVKPTTFMNRSGDAVKKILTNQSVQNLKLLVIIDEYNFPLGKIHIKNTGGAGGHNGMASIIDIIPDISFYRLRCGIDKNFGPGELVDYVLSDFKEDELEEMDRMVEKSVKAIEYLVTINNPDRAMSEINSGVFNK